VPEGVTPDGSASKYAGQPQVGADWYRWSSYNTAPRWMSYWHQISEVLAVRPRACLVVGPGDGTVPEILRRAGIRVTTCDIAPDLEPDVVGDVRDLPFEAASFDAVLCAQVLEHLPFELFPLCLRELRRVTRAWVVLSLPQIGRMLEVKLDLPFVPTVHVVRKLPSKARTPSDEQHHWEIGLATHRRARVETEIRAVFELTRTYTVAENPYHRFFILRPPGADRAL
jgi:predicted SAM-dependent methyltransferase